MKQVSNKTSLKRRELKEEQFRILFDSAVDGVLLADVATKKLYLGNKKICQMLGYSPKEITSLRVNDIHPKKDLIYVLSQFEKQARQEIFLSENLPILRKNGSVFYADVNASIVKLNGKSYLMGIFRESTDKEKTIQQMIEKKVREDAVLHAIGECLIVVVDVDRGGRIVYVNKAFEEITGWKLQEILYKPVVKVLPREDKEGKPVPFHERIVSKVLAGEKVVADLTSPFFYLRKDKSRFPVASVITPIILNKTIIGAVETFRDISKETEADKVKTEFASLVSHQLRTPFATINWYIELLLAGDVGSLNKKQTEYLQEIYKASKRMVDLINVLLSVSRIQMGTMLMEKKLINVVELAKTILNEDKLKIKDKNLKIEERYDKNIPPILADAKQMTMIFQNLIANAIKYSLHRGKISLRIEHKDKYIMVTVADSGIGIPKASQPKIFTRFFRADNAKVKEPEGIGLGLYIVKAVIDMMKGKIWFKSEEKKGTTFYLTIPIREATKQGKKS